MHNYRFPKLKAFCAIVTLSAALMTASCIQSKGVMRPETAHRLAAPAFMHERVIPAAPFALTAYERVRETGGNATIYIEGDGQAWLSRRLPSGDPTPVNPVALHLATRDNGQNVIYLARPCQYSKGLNAYAPCDDRAWWTSKRLAQEVLDSMNAALNDIKKRYGIKKFDLVGFSGGGGVAVLLGTERKDISSIRTVAGNLDHDTFTAYHGISPMGGSINPLDAAAKTASIPQRHFVGEWDDVVPQGIVAEYLKAAGNDRCIQYSIVKEATHEKGWVNKWPELLKEPVRCSGN